jgi:hypothetical protein
MCGCAFSSSAGTRQGEGCPLSPVATLLPTRGRDGCEPAGAKCGCRRHETSVETRAGYSSGSLMTAGSMWSSDSASSSALVVIIIVGVSRRHRINGDDGPVGGNVLRDACGHVGSCWTSSERSSTRRGMVRNSQEPDSTPAPVPRHCDDSTGRWRAFTR